MIESQDEEKGELSSAIEYAAPVVLEFKSKEVFARKMDEQKRTLLKRRTNFLRCYFFVIALS